MKSYLHLIIAAVALVAICTLALSRQSPSPEDSPASGVNPTAAPILVLAREAQEMDESLHQQQTHERVASMEHQQVAQQRYARAAAQSGESRRFINRAHAGSWKSVINTNRGAYLALRATAANSPRSETPCTICDGKSYLAYCILCGAHPGKCPTCQGGRNTAGDEVCPTCLGSGKCYSCSGHARMLCPYCDDGMIRADGHMPNFHFAE